MVRKLQRSKHNSTARQRSAGKRGSPRPFPEETLDAHWLSSELRAVQFESLTDISLKDLGIPNGAELAFTIE